MEQMGEVHPRASNKNVHLHILNILRKGMKGEKAEESITSLTHSLIQNLAQHPVGSLYKGNGELQC